jgi:hypothetical protein
MTQSPEHLAHVFVGSKSYALSRVASGSVSWFGGPMEGEVKGLTSERGPLHHVATLSSNHVGELSKYGGRMALMYGMQYDGCRLEYTYERPNVTVEKLSPRGASKDWPYRGYPPLLPYAPLGVVLQRDADWNQFVKGWSNLPREQPAEMVVLVPPPMTIGLSLWGVHGDWEEVTIVFEVHLALGRVCAYCVCS